MRRLALACLASLALYAALFGLALDRPLELGALRQALDAKLAAAASLPSPKLVILAGSNGPYSHRCTVIGPALGLPCVNAGVALGVGLDYQFARWAPLLHRGDVVYMPMEAPQYARGRLANALGPDASILWRHDRATLASLPPDRWAGALFSFDLRAAVMSLLEGALAAAGVRSVSGETNAQGDHVGHTAALAARNAAFLALLPPADAPAAHIASGYGARLIAAFAREMSARGVLVVGGLATTFDTPPDMAAIAAIRRVYEQNGARFVALDNLSRYPRAAFFDSASHLSEPWQIEHSRRVAGMLAPLVEASPGAPPLHPAKGEPLEPSTFLAQERD